MNFATLGDEMKSAAATIFVLAMVVSSRGQIAAWNISTSGTTVATVVDPNLTASAITLSSSGSISYQASPGDIYCGSWSASTMFSPAGKFWQFSITPNPGFQISISSLTFKAGRTATGPKDLQVQFSLDGFITAGITALGESQNANTSSLNQFTLTALPPTTTSTITFRIWGYAASGTGNFRLNGIVVSGAVDSAAMAGSGIGSALIFPNFVKVKETSDFTIKLFNDRAGVITGIVVVVPPAFTWPMDQFSISLLGNSFSAATLSVNQDTINIIGASVTKTDTCQITIHSVTAPDSAMTAAFLVETAAGSVIPASIQKQPFVTVVKVTRIADLHVNDSAGIPCAPYGIGTTVTVSGIITASIIGSSNVNLFLQDATAGVNVFIDSLNSPFQVGDSVAFTGMIGQYCGTTEITLDSTKWIIYSHDNPLPAPMLLTYADVNQTFNDDFTEPNEGRLVRVNDVIYNLADETITDVTGTTGAYIPNTWVIPAGTFDLVGILKQYKPSSVGQQPSPPFTANYEVDPRTPDDLIIQHGPAFKANPTEANIQPNSVSIDFKTTAPSSAIIRYGTTVAYKDSILTTFPDTVHEIVLSKLSPATAYHYQVFVIDTAGTNTTADAIFSTASPLGTTGTMNVYFNKSVDTSVADGEAARSVDIANKFLSRIDSAKYSIDLALYSFSGNVGNTIAAHLLNAKSRGVKIRMIVEDDNAGATPANIMKDNVPFITDAYDLVNAGRGLMHDKFAVFDFRDTSSFTDDWVWTGSWNATDPGDNDDAQNAIEIQDEALANAYTMEFNEMWGSETDKQDSLQSRFGAHKVDITPHKFNINGTPVELYFSPSDQTTLHICQALAAARYSINTCMFTFTRSDLAQMLVSKKMSGEKVRVVMDNNTDNGNQFDFLQANGVDILLKGSALGSGLLHHKYAIIDAEYSGANKIVITGSHNWSTSAETSNDENELIIHSSRIANLYLQEFKARYLEAGGGDSIDPVVMQIRDGAPASFALSQNYPNPFNPSTMISYQLSAVSYVTLKAYDVLGREVATLVNQKQNAGYYKVAFNASRFASGVYFYRIIIHGTNGKSLVSTKKALLMK